MRSIIKFSLFIILFSCAQKEKVSQLLINNNGIGKYGIGTTFSEFISNIPHTLITTNEDGLLTIYNNENIDFIIGDKNYGGSGIIKDITILSKAYATSNGIHVGISINELKNILKEPIVIYYSDEGYDEYILPKMFQSHNSNTNEYSIIFEIILKSEDNENVGIYSNYQGIGDLTTNFRTNGYVSGIEIYDWN